MKWDDRQESDNVEDRRRFGKTAGLTVGGGGLLVVILGLSPLAKAGTRIRGARLLHARHVQATPALV
jgi:hypothetical protein